MEEGNLLGIGFEHDPRRRHVEECADLRDGRRAGNIYGDHTGLSVGNWLRLRRPPHRAAVGHSNSRAKATMLRKPTMHLRPFG
jgi:hypothetical protein